MNPLQVIFWALFAVAVLFIGWSFVRMPLEELKERRLRRQIQRDGAKTSHSAAGGTQSASDTATSIGSEVGDSGGGDWSA